MTAEDVQEGHHLLVPATNSICSASSQNTAMYSQVLPTGTLAILCAALWVPCTRPQTS